MLGIVGQGVLLGIDALTPTLNNIYPIQSVELKNGTYDYIHATSETMNDFPSPLPSRTEWDNQTIMNCNFDDLNAGNAAYLTSNITSILVKRARVDNVLIPSEADYITLFEIPISSQSSLSFTVNDFTNVYGATYRYKLIPVFAQGGSQIEGSGSASQDIDSLFNGVFLCDSETFIKLRAGVQYGSLQTTQFTGIHETLGGKYPIVVANSNVNYQTGSLSATVINKDYGEITESGTYAPLDRKKIIEARKELEEFLTTKTPKLIKDDSGNIWLVIFTDNVGYDFFNEWGKDLGNISVSWTEIGNAENEDDLSRTRLLGGDI